MKRSISKTVMLAAITLLLAAISAQAQSGHRYQSSVPFDFTVGDQAFKAGDYTLTVVNPESDKAVLSIRSLATGESRLLATIPKVSNPRQEGSELIFNRIGGEYFLSTMTDPQLSVQFRRSKRVRELAKTSGGDPENISVVIKRK